MTDNETIILEALSQCHASSGETNAALAWLVWPLPGSTLREHAARVSALMRDMEKRGLVTRMDAQKPIVWQALAQEDGGAKG